MVNAKYSFIKIISLKKMFCWDTKRFLGNDMEYKSGVNIVPFSFILKNDCIEWVNIEDNKTYKILGVRTYGKGVFINRIAKGVDLKMRKYQKSKVDHLFWCKVDTKNGAFGIITDEFSDSYGSSNMSYLEIDTNKVNVYYLQLLFKCEKFNKYMDDKVVGVTNRKYITKDNILNDVNIPLPDIGTQKNLIFQYNEKVKSAIECENEVNNLEKNVCKLLFEEIGIETIEELNKSINSNLLNFVKFSNIYQWGIDKIKTEAPYKITKYNLISFNLLPKIIKELKRGKSPKYNENSEAIILNQKCNRWNEINLKFAKNVDEEWLAKTDHNLFTKKYDILINSTGEGTIGRASCIIKKEHENLLYDSHILLLRLNIKLIDPTFFVFLFNSNYVQTQINALKGAQATKQTELGIENVKKIQFPLPPLEIQKEIATKIQLINENIVELKIKSLSVRALAKKQFEEAVFGE